MRKLLIYLKKNPNVLAFWVLTFLIVITTEVVFARAGGGGGSSGGGGGGGGGIFGLIIWLIIAIPFPFNIIVIALIVLLLWWGNKQAKKQSVLNKLPTGAGKGTVAGLSGFLQANPEFDQPKFIEKVKSAFTQIQTAWDAQNLGPVRKFISDGVYQRFNTQFKMMKILKQKNTIAKLEVKNVYLDKVESDGNFDIINVAIHASIVDKFVSELYPELNSGGAEEFVEYWSFIKKKGAKEGNLFDTVNCPKCGGDLPKDATDVSICQYCNTITNSGEYDWILSEITQADDYVSSNPKLGKSGGLSNKIREMFKGVSDFSIQNIEDKVSNGYLQIETAKVMKDKTIMRRFVTDEAFEKLGNTFTNDGFVYNRIYLNDVTLIGAKQENQKNILTVAVKASYQRVIPDGKKVQILDPTVTTKTDIVFITRDIASGENKGSLYAHSCPSCGGPIADTIDTKCSFCGAEINSTKNEWIISDVMDSGSYTGYLGDNAGSFEVSVAPAKLDSLFNVRDFAFNNVLIMMAADGVFAEEEKVFAEKIATRWGYSISRIQPMFKLAESGKLVLRMPDNPKQQKKIYIMMEKVAKIDGNVSPEEQALLDQIKKDYSIQI